MVFIIFSSSALKIGLSVLNHVLLVLHHCLRKIAHYLLNLIFSFLLLQLSLSLQFLLELDILPLHFHLLPLLSPLLLLLLLSVSLVFFHHLQELSLLRCLSLSQLPLLLLEFILDALNQQGVKLLLFAFLGSTALLLLPDLPVTLCLLQLLLSLHLFALILFSLVVHIHLVLGDFAVRLLMLLLLLLAPSLFLQLPIKLALHFPLELKLSLLFERQLFLVELRVELHQSRPFVLLVDDVDGFGGFLELRGCNRDLIVVALFRADRLRSNGFLFAANFFQLSELATSRRKGRNAVSVERRLARHSLYHFGLQLFQRLLRYLDQISNYFLVSKVLVNNVRDLLLPLLIALRIIVVELANEHLPQLLSLLK